MVAKDWQHCVVFDNLYENTLPELFEQICQSLSLTKPLEKEMGKVFLALVYQFSRTGNIVDFLSNNRLNLEQSLVNSLAVCFSGYLDNKELNFLAASDEKYLKVLSGKYKTDIGVYFSQFFDVFGRFLSNNVKVLINPSGRGIELVDTPDNRKFFKSIHGKNYELETYWVMNSLEDAYWYAEELKKEKASYAERLQEAIYENMYNEQQANIIRYKFLSSFPKQLSEIVKPITEKFDERGNDIRFSTKLKD